MATTDKTNTRKMFLIKLNDIFKNKDFFIFIFSGFSKT